jgi:hypothetical protein
MSQLSFVPYMSIVHGPIDEKLIKNALCVFEFEVVAGWPIKW